MKSLEYMEAMDKMIQSLPDNLNYSKEFTFYLSVEFAQGLYDGLPLWWLGKKQRPKSGDEFTWKGFNCKVV